MRAKYTVVFVSLLFVFIPLSCTTSTKTVSGTITSVALGDEDVVINMEINLGSNDGLKEGSRGWVTKGDDVIAYIKITSVYERSAFAVVCTNESASKVTKGLIASFKIWEEDKLAPEYTFAVDPQFDGVSVFREGLAGVRIGDKNGYIDKAGTIVIAPQFRYSGYSSEGLVHVVVRSPGGDIHGYIDKSGRYVIEPQFHGAESFSEGLACVSIFRKYGFIDKSGRCVIDLQFDNAGPFSEGLARVKIDGKWGYIDKTGSYVIDPQYKAVGDFSEGLAWVNVDDKYGYIDKTGRYLIEPGFDGPGKFNRINPHVLMYGRYESGDFSEGLAWVKVAGRYGYIDKTGKFAIRPQFDSAQQFSEGMASVKLGNKWGFIDKTGSFVINPQFDDAGLFSEGLACVRVRCDCGYIDKTGGYVVEPQFDLASIFCEGLAAVEIGRKWGFIRNPLKR